jgi:uncharacterized membrane protein
MDWVIQLIIARMVEDKADQKKIRKMEKIITALVVAVPLLIIMVIAVGSLIVPLLGRDKAHKDKDLK